MKKITFLFSVAISLVLIAMGYMLNRNQWVYNTRSHVNRHNSAKYDKLMTYDEMMVRFWEWDINKLLSKGGCSCPITEPRKE